VETIKTMVKRSLEIEKILVKLLDLPHRDVSLRTESCKVMCSVAFEHGESAKFLLGAGNFTSAIGIIRLQYEAIVRAIWLCYAATDYAVNKLMTDLNHESSKKAEKLPMVSQMLTSLEGKAPTAMLQQLLDFKEYSWKPFSSYIHGGIHVVHRQSTGYPKPLIIQVLKASNGLSMMVGKMLLTLIEDVSVSESMLELQQMYSSYLPETKNVHG